VLLGLHGMNDAAEPFLDDAAPLFTAAGVAVYAYDQRGFGGAPHPGRWAGGESLAADAAASVALLRQRHPGVPVFLLGESMGAAVALLAGTGDAPPAVDGYVLLAPALWGRETMPGIVRGVVWLAARTIPVVGFRGNAGGIRASDNPAAMERWAAHPKTLKVTRVDAAYGLLGLMDQAVAAVPACCRGAAGQGVPVLAMVGARDEIVPQRVLRRVLRQGTHGEDGLALLADADARSALASSGVRAHCAFACSFSLATCSTLEKPWSGVIDAQPAAARAATSALSTPGLTAFSPARHGPHGRPCRRHACVACASHASSSWPRGPCPCACVAWHRGPCPSSIQRRGRASTRQHRPGCCHDRGRRERPWRCHGRVRRPPVRWSRTD
jgi:alpha-beta hydrolase superfamily lysophospholipase